MTRRQRPMAAYYVAVGMIAFLGVTAIVRDYNSTFHVVAGALAIAAAVVLATMAAVRRK